MSRERYASTKSQRKPRNKSKSGKGMLLGMAGASAQRVRGWAGKVSENPAKEFNTFYSKGSEPTERTEQERQKSVAPGWLGW